MCGLFGYSNVAKTTLKKAHAALNTLEHRGPDGWSFALEQGVYSGHRRLSILDLSSNGTQPMQAKGVTLTANGEIYNFKELRIELERKHKVKFSSDSDSEVLLHGYICWGIEVLLERIDGMFAFIIHDSINKKIILARDHAGIKPLYYSTIGGDLGWASELKALVSYHGKKNLHIDHTAVYDFLSYLCIPSPKSLYRNIHKLEPAHFATFDLQTGKLHKKRYWNLPVSRNITDEKTAVALVQKTIAASVEEQLVADVPVGTFLSGGVDSSIVSYEASRHVKKLTTCSIGFADASVDETGYALQVSKLIGSRHLTRQMNQSMINKQFGKLREWFDEPFGDASAFPTYQVSALAAENMTVVLTGDGGDELFGGYRHYQEWFQALTPWLGFLFPLRGPVSWLKNNGPRPLRSLFRKAEIFTLLDPLERQIRLRGGLLKTDNFKRKFRKKYNMPENYDELWYVKRFYRPDLPLKSRAMYLDFHTFMHDAILTKVDRTSMAVAIETRVPFLSKAGIASAWQISEKLLFKDGILKGLLKSAYSKKLPHGCLYRQKQGFAVGSTQKTDKLALNGRSLPENILQKLFPELL
ncbi:MAG TPA: asparagine synthase (glutamine-hydrolyzing) [Alphaproteobacteria bacterium]|nr:asparagine synthase (glutamine-hydrolyzing) [Alphaproteobacteria bacterium]